MNYNQFEDSEMDIIIWSVEQFIEALKEGLEEFENKKLISPADIKQIANLKQGLIDGKSTLEKLKKITPDKIKG